MFVFKLELFYKYNYIITNVTQLSGTFSAHDRVESVFKFVESALRHPIQFSLVTPGTPPLSRDNTLLKAAGLVPSGVMNLSTSQKSEFTLLSDELVCKLADI